MKQATSSPPAMPLSPRGSNNGPVDTATLELLASWRLPDATSDPNQIRAAEQDLHEFKKAMNESRTG